MTLPEKRLLLDKIESSSVWYLKCSNHCGMPYAFEHITGRKFNPRFYSDVRKGTPIVIHDHNMGQVQALMNFIDHLNDIFGFRPTIILKTSTRAFVPQFLKMSVKRVIYVRGNY